MRDKLILRFLGFLETMKYILEQSHGVPPVSVALDHTTLKEEGSCGYSSVKTVRSIDKTDTASMGRNAGGDRYEAPVWFDRSLADDGHADAGPGKRAMDRIF